PNNPFRSTSVIEFNMNAKLADRETVTFDYGIPAELFMGKRKGGQPRQPLHYRRLQPQRRRSGSSRPVPLNSKQHQGAWPTLRSPVRQWWEVLGTDLNCPESH